MLELLSRKIREAFAILFPPQPLLGNFQSPAGDEDAVFYLMSWGLIKQNSLLAFYLKRWKRLLSSYSINHFQPVTSYWGCFCYFLAKVIKCKPHGSVSWTRWLCVCVRMQARRSIVRSSKSEDQLSGYEEVRAGPDQDESQRYFSPFDDPQFCTLVSLILIVTSTCLPALHCGGRQRRGDAHLVLPHLAGEPDETQGHHQHYHHHCMK